MAQGYIDPYLLPNPAAPVAPPQSPDVGQMLNPIPGAVDPNDPAKKEELKTGWKQFFTGLRNNPEAMSFLLNAGTQMMIPGTSGGDVMAAGLAGLSAYGKNLTALEERDAERALKEKEVGARIAESEAGIRKSEADIKAGEARTSREQKEFELQEKKTLAELEAQQNRYKPGTPEYMLLQAQIDAEKALAGQRRASAGAETAQAGYYTAGAEKTRKESDALDTAAKFDKDLWGQISGEIPFPAAPDPKSFVDAVGNPDTAAYQEAQKQYAGAVEDTQDIRMSTYNQNVESLGDPKKKPLYKKPPSGRIDNAAAAVAKNPNADAVISERIRWLYGPDAYAEYRRKVDELRNAAPAPEASPFPSLQTPGAQQPPPYRGPLR